MGLKSGFKKFLKGALPVADVVTDFLPITGTWKPLIKGGIRLATKAEPNRMQALIGLVQHVARLEGAADHSNAERKISAESFYRMAVKKYAGEPPKDREVEFAVLAALMHVKGELGMDQLQGEGG